MKNYILAEDIKYAPIHLKGMMHEEFGENKYTEPMSYEWNHLFREKREMPKDLWLFTNNSIKFDYYEQFQGHIISRDFLKLMNEVNSLSSYVISNLEIVSSKGKPKVKKPYHFIKFYEREGLVDYEKSEFDIGNLTGLRNPDDPAMRVEKYHKIVFKEHNLDLFCLTDLHLISYLFCSERFKNLCEEKKMKGILFVDIEDIPKYYYKGYNYILSFSEGPKEN